MKKAMVCWAAAVLFLAALTAEASQNNPPAAGRPLPELKLLKPANSAELRYLGLSGSGTFTVDQISGQAAIIQIFSMYCPYCQKDAPNVNRLYNLIENNPALKGKIKIIGIGVGNSAFEVGTFKQKYKVGFPLIPDGDFTVHKIVGEVRTPYFIVVKLNGSRPPQVIYSRLGAQESIEGFLAEIVKLADVK
jgi:thiol-disulfide isomerase/thioredoxin